ncbi:MAG: carboxypeptidase regulatory-like domain-containing protein [Acidobacteriota bacterium]
MLRPFLCGVVAAIVAVICLSPVPADAELAEASLEAQILALDRELHNVMASGRAMGQPGLDEGRLEQLAAKIRGFAVACGPGCPTELLAKRRQLEGAARQLQLGFLPWAAPVTPDVIAAGRCVDAPAVSAGGAFMGQDGASAWVRFTAPADGTYRVTTAGSWGDSSLALYRRCGVSAFLRVDDTDGLSASASVAVEAGDTLFVEVRGLGAHPVGRVLRGGASISGVARREDGTPFPGLRIRLYDLQTFSSQLTNAGVDGSYSFGSLGDGTYAVLSEVNPSVDFNTAWQDIFCGDFCDPATATPIVIEGQASVTGIDLTLEKGGEIAGRLRDQETGAPVDDAEITLYDADGRFLRTAFADATGRYRFQGLLPGDYRVAVESAGFLDEVWPNVPCGGVGPCDPLVGETIPVTLNAVQANINFGLERLATLVLELVDSVNGRPIPSGRLSVFSETGLFLGGNSQPFFGGLEAGRYYIIADAIGYGLELYEDVPCAYGCSVFDGTLVEVADGETRTVEMRLDPTGSISGTVTESADGTAAFAEVHVFNEDGRFVGVGTTSMVDGTYRVPGLSPGAYRVYSFSTLLQGESWEEIPCLEDCQLVGDLVAVETGRDTPDIDFTLQRFGSISGRVTDAGTGAPISFPRIRIFDAAGEELGNVFANNDGSFTRAGLPAGTYFVTADADVHRREAWDDVPCPEPCDPTSGTPIVLTDAEERSGVDFALDKRPFIRGTVRDAETGQPIPDSIVRVVNTQGQSVGVAFAPDGTYELNNLAEGTYFAVAEGDSRHVSVLWDSAPCFRGLSFGCSVLDGDPIVVGGAGVTADFSLPLGAVLSGTVTASGGTDVPAGLVSLYNPSGQAVASGVLDFTGRWSVEGLGAGTYYALADLNLHADRLWDGLPCAALPCDPTSGTPITVTLGETVAGINFVTDRLGRISGSVESLSGTSDFGLIVLYDAAGERVSSRSINTGGSIFTFEALDPGTYYLTTELFPRHYDRALGGDACEPDPCDPTSGTPFEVAFGSDFSSVEVLIEPGPGFEIQVLSSIGGPVSGVAVDIWDVGGTRIEGVVTGGDGRATLGILTGTYLLSTDAGGGFVDQLWQGVPCPDGPAFLDLCDLGPATPVIAVDPSTLEEVTFVLEALGVIFSDGFEGGDTSAWSAASP